MREGPRKGLRTLAAEEDLGRAVLESLDPEQRKIAVVDQAAYKDILTAASRKAALNGQPSGLSAAEDERAAVRGAAARWWRNTRATCRSNWRRRARSRSARRGATLHFAWAGGARRGEPHYYRVQAPTFLIEYDDTQNNANHIHSVWRDFEGDWGLDLLKQHYEASHR